MRYGKYQQFFVSNPDLMPCLFRRQVPLLGPMSWLAWGIRPTVLESSKFDGKDAQRFIEQKLRYLVVRPFSRLGSKAQSEKITSANRVISRGWVVAYHQEDEIPCARIAFVPEGSTVLEIASKLAETGVVDAAAKFTTTWSARGLESQSVDIYRFPADWKVD